MTAVTLGPIPQSPDAIQLEGAGDTTRVYFTPDGVVKGYAHVEDAPVHCIRITEEAFTRLHAEDKLPTEPQLVLRPEAFDALSDPENVRTVAALTHPDPYTAFRNFLRLWRFRAGETKDIRTLGHLWDGQERVARFLTDHPHTYVLKARKLGFSTVCVGYAGYCARIRDRNSRIHLFSYRERAAKALLKNVRFGLENLPTWLRLPMTTDTLTEIEYDAGEFDARTIVCYPTSDNTAVEELATHSLLDEFADVPRNEVVYGSLEPTFSAEGCTSTIITTGRGPDNWSADYYRKCEDGEGLHKPFFCPADARPGRDKKWMDRKRRTMTANSFKTEYAMSVQDALAGAGTYIFASEKIDVANRYHYFGTDDAAKWTPQQVYAGIFREFRTHRFVIFWDVAGKGERADASVGTVLDITRPTRHVVEQWSFRGLDYPQLIRYIDNLHERYAPNVTTAVEVTGVGAGVVGHLNIPARQLVEFQTTPKSKNGMISGLEVTLQNEEIKWSRHDCPELDREMRGYQLPDTYIRQDHVMSLAGALYVGDNLPPQGRVIGVIHA